MQVQQFLASQNDVVDCRVWEKRGEIFARITVPQHSNLNGADLQSACRIKLGLHLTPRLILMERVSPMQDERAA